MMRAAAILLVAVMATSHVISGTFAKYTTAGQANDTARAAQWGVTIKAGGTLFSDAYIQQINNDPSSNKPTAWNDVKISNRSITVATAMDSGTGEHSSGDNIVAPGTRSYGTGLVFDYSGTTEVAVHMEGYMKSRELFLADGTWANMKAVELLDAGDFADLRHELYLVDTNNGTVTKVGDSDAFDSSATYARRYEYVRLNAGTPATGYMPGYYPVQYYTNIGSNVGIPIDLNAYVDTSVVVPDDGTGNTMFSRYLVGDGGRIPVGSVTDNLMDTTGESPYPTAARAYSRDYSFEWDIPANFDINHDYSNPNMTWEWEISHGDDYDIADTVIGFLTYHRNTYYTSLDPVSSPTGFIAYAQDPESGEPTQYSVVYVDNDYVVRAGSMSGDIIGSLKTYFEVGMTLTQID